MGKEWKIEMNGISLNGFKVIHGGIVLNALALKAIKMRDGMDASNREIVEKPIWLEVLAINEDGNIISIRDEAWTFQFVPNITKFTQEITK